MQMNQYAHALLVLVYASMEVTQAYSLLLSLRQALSVQLELTLLAQA